MSDVVTVTVTEVDLMVAPDTGQLYVRDHIHDDIHALVTLAGQSVYATNWPAPRDP